MKYIFDLDGTLIDSSERMYRLFCELIPECTLTKVEYWSYKRNKVNHKKLIEMLYPKVCFEEFENIWMCLIEEERYLSMDNNFDDTIEVLSKLKNDGDEIFLLTARQYKDGLLKELTRLGIIDFFDCIMTTEGKYTKEDILRKYSLNNNELLIADNIFISDMGKDIELGNKFGFYTIAITHGFMSEEKLMEYNPKRIIHKLSEIRCM